MKYTMRIKIYFIIILYYSSFTPTWINSWLHLCLHNQLTEVAYVSSMKGWSWGHVTPLVVVKELLDLMRLCEGSEMRKF